METPMKPIVALQDYHLSEMKDGHVVLETKVDTTSLNYYGNAHGGFLFTLSDQVAGLVLLSQGVEGVTLQGSINYLKAGHLGDCLLVKGRSLHAGRTTRLVETEVFNQDHHLLCRASFTMFVTSRGQKKDFTIVD